MYAPGEIATLCEIAEPKIGVVTLVAPIHLERLGTIENIANAKAELVEALPADGWAILNGDDERVRAMRAKTQATGLDLWAWTHRTICGRMKSRVMGLEGMEFALHYGEAHLHVQVPLLGQHSVHTALAAAAVGLAQKIVVGRNFERAGGCVGATAFDCGARAKMGSRFWMIRITRARPRRLSALNLLNEMSGRKIAVLGDMRELGEYEQVGHQLVGIRAAEVANVIIAVGALGKLIGDAARERGQGGGALCEGKRGSDSRNRRVTRRAILF